MKGYVQWNPVYVETILARAGLVPGTARSALNPPSYRGSSNWVHCDPLAQALLKAFLYFNQTLENCRLKCSPYEFRILTCACLKSACLLSLFATDLNVVYVPNRRVRLL